MPKPAGRSAGSRPRHVPQRTCVACREVQAKGALVRLVSTADGVVPDPKGKLPGRGAYLHARRDCWERGLRQNLPAALRVELSEADLQRLTNYFSALPEADEA